jgi:hypothetical protein
MKNVINDYVKAMHVLQEKMLVPGDHEEVVKYRMTAPSLDYNATISVIEAAGEVERLRKILKQKVVAVAGES